MNSNHTHRCTCIRPVIIIVSLSWLHAGAAQAMQTSLPVMLPSSALSAVEFSLDNYVELHTLAPGRIPLWPRWSQDATRIGFTATDVGVMQGRSWLSQIWVMDVATAPDATRLLIESQGASCHCLSFVPDDSALLFQDDIPGEWGGRPSLCDANLPDVEARLGINPWTLDPAIPDGAIFHLDIRETPSGCKMVLDMEKYKSPYTTTSIYVIPTDPAGVPNLELKKEILNDVIGISPCRLALSPSGNELLFAYWHSTPKPDVALITGLDRIISGEDLPINAMNDSRVKTFIDGPNHADAPSWSEDGSLIFYGYDFDGRFEMIDMNFHEADFDVMIVRLEDALAGNLVPYRLQLPANQGCICASRGGTRFAFGQTGTSGHRICATGLSLSKEVVVDDAGVVEEPFELKDGAGTILWIPPVTTVFNYIPGADPLRISMCTPVAGLAQNALPRGTFKMPVQRAIRHNNRTLRKTDDPNLSFEPPADLDIAYLNAEIQGINENDLLVYAYNPQTGTFDRFLPVTAHDLDANVISVQLDDVAPAEAATSGEAVAKTGDGLADGSLALGVADSDGDGLSDGREVRWDGNLGLDIYNPDTNPGGTDTDPFNLDTDGDGSSDGQEANFGFDPLSPISTPQLPAAGTLGLIALAAVLAASALRRKR